MYFLSCCSNQDARSARGSSFCLCPYLEPLWPKSVPQAHSLLSPSFYLFSPGHSLPSVFSKSSWLSAHRNHTYFLKIWTFKNICCRIWNLSTHTTPLTKIDSRWIQVLNIKTKTIKILKKYRLYLWPWSKEGLFKWDLKHKSIRKRIDEYDLIKIKNCKAKDIEKKV